MKFFGIKVSALICLATATASISTAVHATVPSNTCSASTNECRAKIVTIYHDDTNAYVVLQGHILPSVCTAAGWGY